MVKKVFENVGTASLRAKTAIATCGTAVLTVVSPLVAHAAEGDVTTGVNYAVESVSGLSSLFTMYPMNIFLGCSVAIMGFKVFRSGKHATK